MESLQPSVRPRVTLRAANVTKLYGETVALWDIDLGARSGELIALHGANGSGKSTLLGILAGVVAPTRGRVAATTDDPQAPPRVAYLGHATHLFEGLSASENVELAARLARRDTHAAVDFLDRLGVARDAGRRVGRLSAGTRRRVGLARALSTDPDILLTDEPFVGLDPDAAELVTSALDNAREEGRLVVLATHDHARSGHLATRVLRLEHGRLLDEDAVVTTAGGR